MDNLTSIFSHSDECSERGGSVNGECALGYGVCCICKCIYSYILFFYLNKAIKMVSRYLGPKGEYLLSSSEKISVFKRERA